MKGSPLLLIVFGLFLAWVGFNGTLGSALASIFSPEQLKTDF